MLNILDWEKRLCGRTKDALCMGEYAQKFDGFCVYIFLGKGRSGKPAGCEFTVSLAGVEHAWNFECSTGIILHRSSMEHFVGIPF